MSRWSRCGWYRRRYRRRYRARAAHDGSRHPCRNRPARAGGRQGIIAAGTRFAMDGRPSGSRNVAGNRSEPAIHPCRRRSSSPPAGADSGRSASPWRVRPRHGSTVPGYCSSLLSSRSNSVKASAVGAGQIRRWTSPLPSFAEPFLALDLITVWPIDTCPVAADHDLSALADGQNGGAVARAGDSVL